MDFDFWLIVFLISHAFISIVILILIKSDILKISMQLYPLVIFLPIFGTFMALKANKYLKKNKTGTKTIQLEKLALSENDYRLLPIDSDDDEKAVVPLEEAILINDGETRRRLLIDVIKHDSKQYVQALKRARENDDVEVTHYASTAIMEIQREYELRIKRLEEEYLSNPNEISVIDTYIKAVKDYIDSGLLQDSVLYLQRQKYDAILTKRLTMPGANAQHYCDVINNLLELKVFPKAEQLINNGLKKWPNNEGIWLIKIKYYHLIGDAEGLKLTISMIKNKGHYISPQVQSTLEYWSGSAVK